MDANRETPIPMTSPGGTRNGEYFVRQEPDLSLFSSVMVAESQPAYLRPEGSPQYLALTGSYIDTARKDATYRAWATVLPDTHEARFVAQAPGTQRVDILSIAPTGKMRLLHHDLSTLEHPPSRQRVFLLAQARWDQHATIDNLTTSFTQDTLEGIAEQFAGELSSDALPDAFANDPTLQSLVASIRTSLPGQGEEDLEESVTQPQTAIAAPLALKAPIVGVENMPTSDSSLAQALTPQTPSFAGVPYPRPPSGLVAQQTLTPPFGEHALAQPQDAPTAPVHTVSPLPVPSPYAHETPGGIHLQPYRGAPPSHSLRASDFIDNNAFSGFGLDAPANTSSNPAITRPLNSEDSASDAGNTHLPFSTERATVTQTAHSWGAPDEQRFAVALPTENGAQRERTASSITKPDRDPAFQRMYLDAQEIAREVIDLDIDHVVIEPDLFGIALLSEQPTADNTKPQVNKILFTTTQDLGRGVNPFIGIAYLPLDDRPARVLLYDPADSKARLTEIRIGNRFINDLDKRGLSPQMVEHLIRRTFRRGEDGLIHHMTNIPPSPDLLDATTNYGRLIAAAVRRLEQRPPATEEIERTHALAALRIAYDEIGEVYQAYKEPQTTTVQTADEPLPESEFDRATMDRSPQPQPPLPRPSMSYRGMPQTVKNPQEPRKSPQAGKQPAIEGVTTENSIVLRPEVERAVYVFNDVLQVFARRTHIGNVQARGDYIWAAITPEGENLPIDQLSLGVSNGETTTPGGFLVFNINGIMYQLSIPLQNEPPRITVAIPDREPLTIPYSSFATKLNKPLLAVLQHLQRNMRVRPRQNEPLSERGKLINQLGERLEPIVANFSSRTSGDFLL